MKTPLSPCRVQVMKKSEALHILGLSDGASDEDIKKAHRTMVRANHPDQFSDPDKKKSAEEKTKLINEARDVLLQRKWDPEYGPRTGGYGNPYTNPYTSYRPHTNTGSGTSNPSGAGGQNQNPYGNDDPFAGYGFPFDYVWTSWDNVGGQGQNTGGANPFDPFSSVFTQTPQKSAQEEMEEAKRDLNQTMAFMGAGVAALAVCALVSRLAIGMYIFTMFAIVFMVFRQVKGCGGAMMLPLLIFFVVPAMSMGFLPVSTAMPDIGNIITFVIAAFYLISTFRQSLDRYNTAKERAKVAR